MTDYSPDDDSQLYSNVKEIESLLKECQDQVTGKLLILIR